MDYPFSFVVAAVDDTAAAEVVMNLHHHSSRQQEQLLLMGVIHDAAAAVVVHPGNFHADLVHNHIDCPVAMHDNVVVVDNFDFPVFFLFKI